MNFFDQKKIREKVFFWEVLKDACLFLGAVFLLLTMLALWWAMDGAGGGVRPNFPIIEFSLAWAGLIGSTLIEWGLARWEKRSSRVYAARLEIR